MSLRDDFVHNEVSCIRIPVNASEAQSVSAQIFPNLPHQTYLQSLISSGTLFYRLIPNLPYFAIHSWPLVCCKALFVLKKSLFSSLMKVFNMLGLICQIEDTNSKLE